jgi:hypothetical protein
MTTVQDEGRGATQLPDAVVRWVHTVRTSPLCGRLHVHRWPWYAGEPGDRLSHCRRGRYRLVVPE